MQSLVVCLQSAVISLNSKTSSSKGYWMSLLAIARRMHFTTWIRISAWARRFKWAREQLMPTEATRETWTRISKRSKSLDLKAPKEITCVTLIQSKPKRRSRSWRARIWTKASRKSSSVWHRQCSSKSTRSLLIRTLSWHSHCFLRPLRYLIWSVIFILWFKCT